MTDAGLGEFYFVLDIKINTWIH